MPYFRSLGAKILAERWSAKCLGLCQFLCKNTILRYVITNGKFEQNNYRMPTIIYSK